MVQLHRESKKFASSYVSVSDVFWLTVYVYLHRFKYLQILQAPEIVMTIWCAGWYLWYKPVRGDTNSGESGQRKSPSGIQGRRTSRESGGQSLTLCERGFHGEHAERKPITGVWAHLGAEPPLGSRGRAPGHGVRCVRGATPLKLKAF